MTEAATQHDCPICKLMSAFPPESTPECYVLTAFTLGRAFAKATDAIFYCESHRGLAVALEGAASALLQDSPKPGTGSAIACSRCGFTAEMRGLTKCIACSHPFLTGTAL